MPRLQAATSAKDAITARGCVVGDDVGFKAALAVFAARNGCGADAAALACDERTSVLCGHNVPSAVQCLFCAPEPVMVVGCVAKYATTQVW